MGVRRYGGWKRTVRGMGYLFMLCQCCTYTHTHAHIFSASLQLLSSIEAFHMLPAPVCGGCGLGDVAHMHIVY